MPRKNKNTHPNKTLTAEANKKLFLAVPFGYGAIMILPNAASAEMVVLMLGLVLMAARLSFEGLQLLHRSYLLRRDWAQAQSPSYSVENENGGWCNVKQMREAGMYDGVGRILGMDMRGRLLFMPHKLRPTHSWIEFPAGMGKTTTSVIASALLTPLSKAK